MNTTPLSRQYNPATYNELGIVKIGDGLFIDNAGELSLGFEVTATAGTGGSITPAGTTHVQAGGEITLTITPDENYCIDTVTINGVQEATPANKYTFSDLSENKIITVTFFKVLFENGIFNNEYYIGNVGYNQASNVSTTTQSITINESNYIDLLLKSSIITYNICFIGALFRNLPINKKTLIVETGQYSGASQYKFWGIKIFDNNYFTKVLPQYEVFDPNNAPEIESVPIENNTIYRYDLTNLSNNYDYVIGLSIGGNNSNDTMIIKRIGVVLE